MSNIFLREIERRDLGAINRWRADYATVSQLGAPFRFVGPSVDDRWFDNYLATRAENVRLAICLEDGEIIGAAYLLGIDWTSRNAELAVWIGDRSMQGQGIGERAVRLTLDHGFLDLNLERIYLTVLRENERAIRLYRKVGFRDEGIQRSAVYKRGEFRDILMMAILRSEYLPSVTAPESLK